MRLLLISPPSGTIEMKIAALTMHHLQTPFHVAFAHAAASRLRADSVLVRATSDSGQKGYGEGCPRAYVTGESVDSALSFFAQHRVALQAIVDLQQLQAWVERHEDVIDANAAAWCAIELALLDLLGKEHGQSVEALLGLPELQGSFRYSAVLGLSQPQTFAQQFERYVQLGFGDFKVKVSGNLLQDRANIARFKALPNQPVHVRLDANNLWQYAQQAIDYIDALNFSFTAIEEALQPLDYQGYREMFEALGIPMIVDESFTCSRQFTALSASPESWIINLRVSKMGGMLRSLAIAAQARALGVPIVVGAQVGETSILTRAALTVAHAHRNIVTAQEGAFGTHLLHNDLADPPLMFGAQGILEIPVGLLEDNGWGFRVIEPGMIKP